MSSYFGQTVFYSMLCAFVPAVIYLIFKTRRETILHGFFTMLYLVYAWLVFMITGMGTIGDISHSGNVPLIRATINTQPFYHIDTSFYLNILMFVPLGFLLPFLWKGYRRFYATFAFSIAFSALIETSQLITVRATDIDDIIANTAGGMIGYIIWKILSLVLKNITGADKYRAHEPIVLTLLMFFGLFFLYDPQWFTSKIAPMIKKTFSISKF